jgi:hypothetical protein
MHPVLRNKDICITIIIGELHERYNKSTVRGGITGTEILGGLYHSYSRAA